MDFTEMLALGTALSMDSFALSLANGICTQKRRLLTGLLCALCFGLFQGSMTTIGYAAGTAFSGSLKAVDSFIAPALLCFIGVKTLMQSRDDMTAESAAVTPGSVLTGGFATSVDALAAGVGLSVLGSGIVGSAAVITLISLLLSLLGFFIGSTAGKRLGSKAKLLGGLVLIGLGVKIFAEHIFF